MAKQKAASFIEAAIPLERGAAEHIEHSSIAMTVFSGTGEVTKVYTPPETIKRLHEVLHARHSHPEKNPYLGAKKEVAEIVEDCVLHLNHWPWESGQTPEVITNDAMEEVAKEIKGAPFSGDPYAAFATRLRAASLGASIHGDINAAVDRVFDDKAPTGQPALARSLLHLIKDDKALQAALMIQGAFFSDEDDEYKSRKKSQNKRMSPSGEEFADFDLEEMDKGAIKPDPTAWNTDDGGESPIAQKTPYGPLIMEIIKLELSEDIVTQEEGLSRRVSTSGPRIYRPALRRPILPQRMFIRTLHTDPGGVVLFDASGSMDASLETLLDCCRRAPAATIAFYCGKGEMGEPAPHGWLIIFAKDGKRAAYIPKRVSDLIRGNLVDGPAMDWLMQQSGPRIMVTDRGFDFEIQKVRLGLLEKTGDVIVYPSYASFKKKFPELVKASP